MFSKIGIIGHNAKAIAFAKWSFWIKNYNCQKHAKSDSRTTLELICVQKNGSKKHLIFEKWHVFENRHNWPQCKGYSLCKMVIFDKSLKLSKTCQKRFWNHIRVLLCKNGSKKKHNIRKMTCFLKTGIIGHNAKAITFAKWSFLIKR